MTASVERLERGWWDGRVFFSLLAAAAIGSAAVFPYALAVGGIDPASLPAPYAVVLLASMAQTTLLAALAIAIGMWLGHKVGLGVPMLSDLLWRRPGAGQRLLRAAFLAVPVGALAAALVLLLDGFVFRSVALQLSQAVGPQGPTSWSGLLASFYGGIVEELLLRFGVMTFLAWLLVRVARTGKLVAWQLWTANGLAAVLFGLGHLPTTAALVPLTAAVVLRAVVLNGIPGVAFGWLYWRDGLLAAMIAHFSADIVLHFLVPALS
ncbi:MAG: CPBP family intramembrane glutamic endopeptidase [Anaerolineales bacterium]